MAAPLLLALCAACLSSAKTARADEVELPSAERRQETLVSVERGDNLTLSCAYRGELGAARLNWYKQAQGLRPKHVSAFYSYNRNGSLYDEFQDGSRFSLDTTDGKNNLEIKDVRGSDTGMYYCISCFLHTLEFIETVSVSVRGPGLGLGPGLGPGLDSGLGPGLGPALVHQPAVESVQLGGSVNLSCTVHAGTCKGQSGVSWFRRSVGGEENTGVLGGGGTASCVRNDSTHTCVYNLPLRNLDHSHTGTYYCVAAACGHLLIGNGTKLDFGDKGSAVPLLLWYVLGGAFAVAVAASLAFSACTTSSRQATGDASTSHKLDAKEIRDAEKMYFPALQRRRRGDQTWSECVYYCNKK